MENSRKCDVCIINVHRATYANFLGSEKHLEKGKPEEMILPELLFREPNEND